METTQILSSDILDIIFDDRNKEYGAYELRKTYHKRIGRSLIITISVVLFVLLCSAWAGFKKTSGRERVRSTVVEISELKPMEKKVEPPKPIIKPQQPQVQMKQFTPPVIQPNDIVDKPPPQIDDLADFRIGDEDKKGIEDIGIPDEKVIDSGRNIIDKKKFDEDLPFTSVEVQASFPGGDAKWRQYLERNCNGQVATDNGAPEGVYTTVIQFVVDKEGNISDVQALTNHGYGMEQEAMRVIRKGPKWNPAFQNTMKVKAYRKQPITFQVSGE